MAVNSKSSYSNKVLDIVIPVYNDNPYLAETLMSIYNQQLPNGWNVQVYIVDDGSDLPISLDVSEKNRLDVRLVRLEKNAGCSVARNKGASVGSGVAVLFLDADCSLVGSNVLALLLEKYLQGYDVCFGQIHAPQGDFWAKYQNDVAKERALRFKKGDKWSMTTSIFIVNRQVFESIGGFDDGYHFGFEDRDLFISLIKSGARVSLVEKAMVNHNDKLSLLSVTKKLYAAGKDGSLHFIKKHPAEYAELAYAKVDARYCKKYLKLLMLMTRPVLWLMVGILDWCIKNQVLPYKVARVLVKYVSGLVYLNGTKAASL